MEDAYTKTVDKVLKHFQVSESLGLTQEEVKRSRQKYGPNGNSVISNIFTPTLIVFHI